MKDQFLLSLLTGTMWWTQSDQEMRAWMVWWKMDVQKKQWSLMMCVALVLQPTDMPTVPDLLMMHVRLVQQP